jgi:pyrrolysine biosynthesis protein PylD
MTRLQPQDILRISSQLQTYDLNLLEKTGKNLLGIASHACGINEEQLTQIRDIVRVAVIPITIGKGLISGFSNTVKAILEHIGFRAFVTEKEDVQGISQAFEKKADIIFLADDLRFVSISVKEGIVVDNSDATARGYVAGLDLMAGGIEGRAVLVMGCGPVGRSTAKALIERGAQVAVYDILLEKSEELAKTMTHPRGCPKMQKNAQIWNSTEGRGEPGVPSSFCDSHSGGNPVRVIHDKEIAEALSTYSYIVEATHAAEVIDEEIISAQTCIVAPGVPLGVTQTALERLKGRLLHDKLEIGVATMAIEALKHIWLTRQIAEIAVGK